MEAGALECSTDVPRWYPSPAPSSNEHHDNLSSSSCNAGATSSPCARRSISPPKRRTISIVNGSCDSSGLLLTCSMQAVAPATAPARANAHGTSSKYPNRNLRPLSVRLSSPTRYRRSKSDPSQAAAVRLSLLVLVSWMVSQMNCHASGNRRPLNLHAMCLTPEWRKSLCSAHPHTIPQWRADSVGVVTCSALFAV